MHNHNRGNNWMKWGMVFCCALPLLLIMLWGFGGNRIGVTPLVTWGGIALMVGVHLVMMIGSYKHSKSENDMTKGEHNDEQKAGDKDPHSGSGCCH